MDFTVVDSVKMMPIDEMCSYCYTTMLKMRQASVYGSYTELDKENLELIQLTCGLTGSTELHDPPYTLEPTPKPVCVSNTTYTIQSGDTCDKLAMEYSVASAAILYTNPTVIGNCSRLPPGRDICMPLSCDRQYTLQDDDNCWQLEYDHRLAPGSIPQYNPWLESDCLNMQDSRELLGSVLCFPRDQDNPITILLNGQYAQEVIAPPADFTVAPGTTMKCGRWYASTGDVACFIVCLISGITENLFVQVNPSVPNNCDHNLLGDGAYCVGPVRDWNENEYLTGSTATAMSSRAVSTALASAIVTTSA